MPAMHLPFTLEPGERLLWARRASGVHGHGQLAITLGVLLALPGLWAPVGILFALSTLARDPALGIQLLVSYVVCSGPFALIVAAWLAPRARESLFVTDRALVWRTLRGGVERVPLASVRAAERYVAVYQGRYGPREIVTDRMRAVLDDGREILFGPSKDIDRVLEWIEYGVLGDWVELPMLPAVAGDPPPAETRPEFFVCARTETDGDTYGPLFVGPTRIVRLTEELSGHLLGRLYTVLGRAFEGDDAEAQAMALYASAGAGHYVELPRAGARFVQDGRSVRIRSASGAELAMTLAASDADRLRAHLAAQR